MGIGKKMVEAMVAEFGTEPKDLEVSLGPSIGPCCFSCHEDVPEAMIAGLGDKANPFITAEGGGKWAVDLQGIHRQWLTDCGVEKVDWKVPCTACDGEEFWSHRVLGDQRGSMGGMIALTEEEA